MTWTVWTWAARACALSVLLGIGVGCASETIEPIDHASAAVVNGRVNTGDPWAVAVVNLGLTGQPGLCSGSRSWATTAS